MPSIGLYLQAMLNPSATGVSKSMYISSVFFARSMFCSMISLRIRSSFSRASIRFMAFFRFVMSSLTATKFVIFPPASRMGDIDTSSQ